MTNPKFGIQQAPVIVHWRNDCLCIITSLEMLFTQLYLTLCDPKDCSPPGFSVHGILQARILEWVAIPLISPSLQADSLPSEPPEKPIFSFFKVLMRGERFKREGTHVHGWLNHSVLQQKAIQHCKAIIL